MWSSGLARADTVVYLHIDDQRLDSTWTADIRGWRPAISCTNTACREQRYALGNVLGGARFSDKEAAQKSNR
jgi:hypothetical protein